MLGFLELILIGLINFNNVVLCDLENYDVVIIPVSNIAIKPDKGIEFTVDSDIGLHSRLDIEHYEEPTEMPDLDSAYYDDRDEYKYRNHGMRKRKELQLYPKIYPPSVDFVRARQKNYKREPNNYNSEIGLTRIRAGSNPADLINTKVPQRHKLYYSDEDGYGKLSKHNIYYSNEEGDELDTNYNRDNSDEISQHMRNSQKYYDANHHQEASYGEDKIVGGFEVEVNLYPYHVAYGTNCGGAIIDSKWVVTAGHCGNKPYIRVGSKHLNQGKKVNIKNHFVHPMWSARNKDHPFDYDFQLLELAEPLKFNEDVQVIKVAHIEDMVIGKVVTVTGWGNTKENGPYSTLLRAVRVPIISKENCQSVPFPYFRGSLTPRMFCAGFKEGKKDACQGDSGGPAVAYDRLLGMVSFGYGCATPGSYGVYSKVAKVRSWIEQTTGLTLS